MTVLELPPKESRSRKVSLPGSGISEAMRCEVERDPKMHMEDKNSTAKENQSFAKGHATYCSFLFFKMSVLLIHTTVHPLHSNPARSTVAVANEGLALPQPLSHAFLAC